MKHFFFFLFLFFKADTGKHVRAGLVVSDDGVLPHAAQSAVAICSLRSTHRQSHVLVLASKLAEVPRGEWGYFMKNYSSDK